ncbi:AraC-like ligand binding domain protein [Clostridium sp. KLE 1755]|nr:AraC-like ligand binding domain protein [Clostridium sp. KLE 1755]
MVNRTGRKERRTAMLQEQEQRHVYYDRDLDIEAYNLSGIVQKFPNHFHEYYVIGFIEGGKRHLWCKGKEYDTSAGDLILFNPRDNHYCAPVNGELLDYRAVNIKPEVMSRAVKEITGEAYMPYFTETVVYKSDIAQSVQDLYRAVLNDAPLLEKEENLFFLLDQILREYASDFESADVLRPNRQIQSLCQYMEEHFAENVTLDDLLSMTDFGKSYLLRSFTRQTGVSPYRYLQTIRLDKAKRFLEEGIAPIDAAGMAGFSDQSHFTHFFKEFIGLTPKQYQRIFQDKEKDSNETGEGEDETK